MSESSGTCFDEHGLESLKLGRRRSGVPLADPFRDDVDHELRGVRAAKADPQSVPRTGTAQPM